MSGSARKRQTQKLSTIGDEDKRSSQSRTCKGRREGSTAVSATMGQTVVVQEDDAYTPPLAEEPGTTSVYDIVSEVLSFPPPTASSSKGKLSTRASSPKK